MTAPAAFPALGVFLGRDDVREVFFYGIAIAVAVVLLFLVTHLLRLYFTRRARRIELPFGIEPGDLDKLKRGGQLTDEELKAVRKAMSRRFLERTEEQEAAKHSPGKAEVILRLAEEEFLASRDRGGEASPREAEERMDSAETPAKPPPDRNRLPAHLLPLADRSPMELEEMHQAGFLSAEDFRLLRDAQGGNGEEDEV